MVFRGYRGESHITFKIFFKENVFALYVKEGNLRAGEMAQQLRAHILFLKKLYDLFIFYFMCIGEKVSGLLEPDFQTVVSCYVGAGN